MKFRILFLALLALAVASFGMAQKTGQPATGQKPAVKKELPPRDPKTGRFMKKEEPKTTAAKQLPPRDPKTGRFIKKDAPKTGVTAKQMPPRDPKTGKFMKKEAPKTGVTAKQMPPRDPKTGKFLKKTDKTKVKSGPSQTSN